VQYCVGTVFVLICVLMTKLLRTIQCASGMHMATNNVFLVSYRWLRAPAGGWS
jgi:hypothetical protein